MTDADGEELRRVVAIANRRGLHARAAAKFVKLAGSFDAVVSVARDDVVVCGVSIMGLMMLAAAPGSDIELTATGSDATAAVDALAALITDKFQED